MTYGIIPHNPFHLLFALLPVILWWVTRQNAKQRQLTSWHNAALGVSFWEEVLFRGLILGVILTVSHNQLLAVVVSSILFGLFHLRNLWWSNSRDVVHTCLYTGIFIGPILAVVRIWSGDIYLGVLLHYLNNFVSMQVSHTLPTDNYLSSRSHQQNWFERLFSGYWLRRVRWP